LAHTVIRGATADDYDAVIGSLDEWWGGRPMAAMLPRLFFAHFAPWAYVAVEAEGPVGFLAAFRSQSDPRQMYCHFVGVDPRSRGRGVGEALYQRLFADALAQGCAEVLSVTSPVNLGSIRFHQRLGFAPLPGNAAAHGVPFTRDYDGPGEDRVRFRRPLAPDQTSDSPDD
jgi:GNAT superfamily N-acetyltransferase